MIDFHRTGIGAAAGALIVVVLFSTWAGAAVVPGRWEKAAALPAGAEVSVTLKSGDLIQGAWGGMMGRNLLLTLPGGTEFTVAPSEVRRISTLRETRDSLLNGTLLGLAGGLALGALLVATDSSAGFVSQPGQGGASLDLQSRSGDSDLKAGPVLAATGSAGALIGLFLDRAERGKGEEFELVYQAP